MTEVDDSYIGTTLGIVGAGVSLYALKGVVDMVNPPRKQQRRRKYSSHTRRRETRPYFGDGHFRL